MLVLPFIGTAVGKGVFAMTVHFILVPLSFISSPIIPFVCSLTLKKVRLKLTFIRACLQSCPHGICDFTFLRFDKSSVDCMSVTASSPAFELANKRAAIWHGQSALTMFQTTSKLTQVKLSTSQASETLASVH